MKESKELVILVTPNDEIIGTEEKIKAHQLGLLHRAFSVFVYRSTVEGIELLLQKRQAQKYHCGGLWTNTCCSHPRLNEPVILAGQRRLKEEMSLEVPLRSAGSFIYRAKFENGLTEHELDHVLLGEYSGQAEICFNPEEVEDYQWILISSLQQALEQKAELYTPWLKPALDLAVEAI